MSIWRLQTNTSKGGISKYCIENSIAAVGWSLSELSIPTSELKGITFEDYCNYAEDLEYHYDSVSRLYYLNENDLIWMKSEGIYYIARVSDKSKWHFCVDDEAINLDACNQVTDIKWLRCGDESSVPGAITTAFIKGSTFQRIWKAGVKEFSELIYNELSKTNQYDTKIELNQDTFYSLISPSDCEDLLCMWLFNTYGYVCIPSTNKIATQKYECVLLDPAIGKHIYIQVKNGEINLNSEDYYNTFPNSEFWLLSTKGTVQIDDSHKNVRRADPTTLFEFACEDKNENIIPPSIKYWIIFATKQQNKSIDGVKGIMFDTNSPEDENEMLLKKKVCAWGAPKRYIEAFNKGDYILYYSKGKGVIAAGIITSLKAIKIDNGLQMNVEPIVFPCKDNIFISAKEIKNLLNKDFFFASTRKVPFLTQAESKVIIDALKQKCNEYF